MSKKNRERRAAKQRQRRARGSHRPGDRHQPRATVRQRQDASRPEAGAGTARPSPEAEEHTAFQELEVAVTNAWRCGWQPADLAPIVRKDLGARHARLIVDVVVHEAQQYAPATLSPRWRDQLAGLDANLWWDTRRSYLAQFAEREGTDRDTVLAQARMLAVSIRMLPPQPVLGPRPGEFTSSRPTGDRHQRPSAGATDGRMLARVRALLAKAESTTFPSEAEALTAKAQELMARHAIDRAMIDADAPRADGPVGRRMPVEDPYAKAKALLASTVARANQCRAVISERLGFVTVFGHEADVDGVELLYTSLLVQATAAMAAAGKDSGLGRHGRTASFRRSFMAGYAHRIGQRLDEATQASTAAAAAVHGDRLLPVLANRGEAVDAAVDEAFPTLRPFSMSVSNGSGWARGQAAGEQANLGVRQAVEPAQAS